MSQQVAMGQGQAEIAMQLLHECATSGEWLCLKNLHLVTAWLPTLEKVLLFDISQMSNISHICPIWEFFICLLNYLFVGN